MLQQSPSGLFTRDQFRLEGPGPDTDRHFALWVKAKAQGLAAQLDARVSKAVPLAIVERIEGAADVLWLDYGWARGQVARLEAEASARRAA